MIHRKLTDSEIGQLKSQNCFSQSWEKILVVDGFGVQYIRNVTFIGDIKLGFFN